RGAPRADSARRSARGNRGTGRRGGRRTAPGCCPTAGSAPCTSDSATVARRSTAAWAAARSRRTSDSTSQGSSEPLDLAARYVLHVLVAGGEHTPPEQDRELVLARLLARERREAVHVLGMARRPRGEH